MILPLHMITAGAVFFFIGVIVRYLLMGTLRGAVPVDLEVVKVHSDDGDHTFYLEFEVTSGTYKGRRCESGFRSSLSSLELGDHSKGYYNPHTQEIESSTTIKLARRLSIGLMIVSGIVILGSLALVLRP